MNGNPTWDRRLLEDRAPNPQVLRIEDLNNDPRYQRDLSAARVDEMVTKFNPGELTMIIVSKREDGTLWIVDGRHRAEMLLRLGKSVIWADVMEGLTYQQEAWLFYRLNENHRAMSSWFRFNARVQAGEAVATAITNIVEKHGYYITKANNNQPRSISAVRAAENLYDMGQLQNTLTILDAVWPHDRMATSAEILQGLGVFLLRFFDDPNYDSGQLAVSIDKLGPSGIIRRARELQLETGRSAQGGFLIAVAFRDAYNGLLVRGSRPKRKLTGAPIVSWKSGQRRGRPG